MDGAGGSEDEESSGSATSSSSSSSSEEEEEDKYPLRQRRAAQTVNYNFTEYDELINSAIQVSTRFLLDNTSYKVLTCEIIGHTSKLYKFYCAWGQNFI